MSLINLARKEISDIGKRLYQKGFVPGSSGNISVRIDDQILISSSGTCLGDITPEEVVLIDFQGNILEKNKKPSSEKDMHIEIYKVRPDIKAIVHAHPPKSTSFAVAGIPLNKQILAESVVMLGDVPVAEYAKPSSKELALTAAGYCKIHNAVLLANHGVLTLGNTMLDAFHRIETLELYSEIYLWSKVLGNSNELSGNDIEDLVNLRNKMHSA